MPYPGISTRSSRSSRNKFPAHVVSRTAGRRLRRNCLAALMFEALTQHLKLPDLWQHAAVNHLRAGSDVIVSAPTGAGKTYVFELFVKASPPKGQAV
ncbi:DEAD/DEAH box helicase, partial [Verrucomicrobium sp. BvORR034]|uniref:DEAD/DEAH box helicase n=1 Tax=Verrucomicrobium sp. BvORR034 TaxID=1396418 RepID=UPI0031B5C9EA